MTRSRRPIVSVAGETRSNGSVSHAGNSSTASSPRNSRKSVAIRSASTPVGTATTMGRRAVALASVATKRARAGSGTATGRARPPVAAATTGSSANRVVIPARVGGMSARSTRERGRAPGVIERRPRPPAPGSRRGSGTPRNVMGALAAAPPLPPVVPPAVPLELRACPLREALTRRPPSRTSRFGAPSAYSGSGVRVL